MGGNIRCHPHRDPCGPVNQQVGETRWQYLGFFFRSIVIILEIDRILVDITQHFHGNFAHLGFGIPHGGRAVPVDRTKVTVTIDQHATIGEILGHSN